MKKIFGLLIMLVLGLFIFNVDADTYRVSLDSESLNDTLKKGDIINVSANINVFWGQYNNIETKLIYDDSVLELINGDEVLAGNGWSVQSSIRDDYKKLKTLYVYAQSEKGVVGYYDPSSSYADNKIFNVSFKVLDDTSEYADIILTLGPGSGEYSGISFKLQNSSSVEENNEINSNNRNIFENSGIVLYLFIAIAISLIMNVIFISLYISSRRNNC